MLIQKNYALEKNNWTLIYIAESLCAVGEYCWKKRQFRSAEKIDRKVTVEILLCVFLHGFCFEIMGWTKGESYRYFHWDVLLFYLPVDVCCGKKRMEKYRSYVISP